MKRIFEEILSAAQAAGACEDKGLAIIRKANSVDDLIALMKTPQGIEFCMENQFPPTPMLLEYEAQLLKNNIIVEGYHELNNPEEVIVFGGEVVVNIDGFNICQVYATNNAKVVLRASQNAVAIMEAHGESKVFSGSIDRSKLLFTDKRLITTQE